MENTTLRKIIGQNIAKHRERAGMTQAQLADSIGISSPFLSRVERGEKCMKIETLSKAATVLKVSCDALLTEDSPSAHIENINRLLVDQPVEYLSGIEHVIRTCIEEFEPKKESYPCNK